MVRSLPLYPHIFAPFLTMDGCRVGEVVLRSHWLWSRRSCWKARGSRLVAQGGDGRGAPPAGQTQICTCFWTLESPCRFRGSETIRSCFWTFESPCRFRGSEINLVVFLNVGKPVSVSRVRNIRIGFLDVGKPVSLSRARNKSDRVSGRWKACVAFTGQK